MSCPTVLPSSINLSILQYYGFSIYETTHHHGFSSNLAENLMNLKRGWASSESIWNLAEMVGPRHKQLRNYPHCRVLCAGERKRATNRLTVTVLLEQKRECWLVIIFQGIKVEGAHMKETLPFTSAPRIPTALWPVCDISFIL